MGLYKCIPVAIVTTYTGTGIATAVVDAPRKRKTKHYYPVSVYSVILEWSSHMAEVSLQYCHGLNATQKEPLSLVNHCM